jgi:hypothetical protein
MRKVCLVLVVGAVVCGSARPALAVQQFYNAWAEVYLKDNPNEEYVKTVTEKQTQCLVCHQGKSRKNRNAYGAQLDVLLDKRKDVRDVEKMKAAFAKVGEMHIDPKDDKSPTFDELIKKGELPGGKLEDLKKDPEPKKDDAK